ncbi:MAG: Tim44 domain-containing protein [Bacteroidales bacterium]|nr:Tim44 domain-containing protein [Bacteroidales bacterium]
MKNLNLNKLKKYLPFFLMIVALVCCNLAIADVGNNNRYSSSDGGDFGGGDFDIGVLIGWLINLFIQSPVLGLIVVVIIIIAYRIMKKKSNNTDAINQRVNQQASNDFVFDNSSTVAAQIQNIDPNFSSDKFIGFAREVFMKIQEAWTTKDWKSIRPFESETLFNQHKQQLDEYIRLKKTNVVEKITIKHCSLHSFRQDGDKEVLTVFLNAMMRDYVIDDETKKVLESDPNRDWYMKYEMVFNRKAGVKTDPGKKGNTITNCPNCGAPTEITSSGQCAYCGSVITNGEHDWVLTDIHSRN